MMFLSHNKNKIKERERGHQLINAGEFKTSITYLIYLHSWLKENLSSYDF